MAPANCGISHLDLKKEGVQKALTGEKVESAIHSGG
jgi:hypothetical protein